MIKKQAGFTLLEMSVVLAIIAILSAVAIPNILTWLPGYRAKSAADDLFGNLQLARTTAIKTHQPCTVTFSSGKYTIDVINRTVSFSQYSSDVRYGGPGGETYPSGGKITFSTRGLPSLSGYIYLTNSNGTAFYRVGTLTSGVVRKQKWSGSSWE
jgi:type IV fimbrial biogenesis protein FimT